jgi:hypothetical protein
MKEVLNLRCCFCSYEFLKELLTSDRINEEYCPNCHKVGGVEINLGKNNNFSTNKEKEGRKYE